MKLTWFGHAMFLIEADGLRIVTDPYSPEVGYPVPAVEADVVTVSHEHFDHNNLQAVKGSPRVIKEPQKVDIAGVTISGIRTFHDEVRGGKRGTNIIFKIAGDVKVAHFGDFGEPELRPEVEEFLADVDVVLIPVGGTYTIDAEKAARIVNALPARVIVPMHYKTAHLSFDLDGVDRFLRLFQGEVEHAGHTLTVTPQKLPRVPTVFIMEYKVQ